MLALRSDQVERRPPALLLTGLAAVGVLFTVYLTYLELFVIRAICRWCVGSAAIIVSVLVLALLGRRDVTEPRVD
jgi:uncharacterized membrane protein